MINIVKCRFVRALSAMAAVRIERDSFGDIDVPADKLYGANTARSLRNFSIGDERDRMPVSLVAATVEGFVTFW